VAAAALVARTLASIPLRGELARDLFQPFRARIDIDGELSEGSYTVAGAATVQHVGIGFAPFLTAGLHTDRFHWLATGASAARLGREIPAFAVGIYREGSCLQHASPRRVELRLEQPEPYTIDGDLFPKVSHIVIEAGPVLRFITP
jgi:diacylglycerol kinase family enzyme